MVRAADKTISLDGILSPEPPARPLLSEQGDIRYYSTRARSVLNTPETTGMGYWSINPYVGCAFGCAYCYARYAHRYALQRAVAASTDDADITSQTSGMPPWLAFERRVFVKENAPIVLRHALRHGSDRHLQLIRGESLVIGTATDPYQPAERKYRVTRNILEVLAEHPGLDISIVTKSPLITRDIDLLNRIARNSGLTVHISLITPHRDLARRLEPRSPTPEARLRALARLREAGVNAGIFCMPVLPGITDRAADLEELVRRVAEAGATHFAAGSLRLRSTARERYIPVIAKEFPELLDRYQRTYARGYQLPDAYREGLRRFVRKLCTRYGVSGMPDSDDESGGDDAENADMQLDLFPAELH